MIEKEDNAGNSGIAPDSDNFFEQLEREVNSVVLDDEPIGKDLEEQVTQPQEADSEKDLGVNYEKRYKDSSREALKQREVLNQYEPFFPVLDKMKEDPEMVNVVRSYLERKQSPLQNVKEDLNLDDEFVFDFDEAITNEKSDSAKVYSHVTNKIVNAQLDQAMQRQQAQMQNAYEQDKMARDKAEFMSKRNMSEEEFGDMMAKANKTPVGYEDIYYMLNRDKTSQNIAANERKNIIGQMQNARNVPASAGAASSAGGEKTVDDQLIDSLLGVNSNMNELFG